jgi:hypothetical protein
MPQTTTKQKIFLGSLGQPIIHGTGQPPTSDAITRSIIWKRGILLRRRKLVVVVVVDMRLVRLRFAPKTFAVLPIDTLNEANGFFGKNVNSHWQSPFALHWNAGNSRFRLPQKLAVCREDGRLRL